MNKAILINKEIGYTSRDVVNKLNKIFKTKKIGHTGTLDPLASGVLLVLVGKYTKLVDLITNENKEYIATIRLGILTDTLDITGNILKSVSIPKLKIEEIKEVLASFIGKYEETIPLYSAVHINGKRLYEYARENKKVDLPKRIVCIEEIELLDYHNDLIKFRCLVSKGTYIRSLIQDICSKLNTIGCMEALIRTKQGKFSINNSYTLEQVANNNYQEISINDLIDLEIKNITDEELIKKIINGNVLKLDYNGYILFKNKGKDLALYYFEKNVGKLKILF